MEAAGEGTLLPRLSAHDKDGRKARVVIRAAPPRAPKGDFCAPMPQQRPFLPRRDSFEGARWKDSYAEEVEKTGPKLWSTCGWLADLSEETQEHAGGQSIIGR